MEWLQYASYVLGGAVLTNAVAHFGGGVMGRPFQSPIAKPPGKGLSSSTVNVLWSFLNAVVSYLLICHFASFDPRSTADVAALGSGGLLMGIMLARTFGRLHGGTPRKAHEP
jgi:hypothetical protein